MSWATVVVAGIGLTGTTIGVASKQTTLCGKRCRAKCRGEKGFLGFGEKKVCKKDCKSKCLAEPANIKEKELRQEQEKIEANQKNIKLILIGIAGIVLLIAISFIVYKKINN